MRHFLRFFLTLRWSINFFSFLFCGQHLSNYVHEFRYNLPFFADPPEVHINVQVKRFPVGERVNINCTVRSSPASTITWKRNQETLFSGGNHQIHEKNYGIVTKSRLEILELDHSDNLATYSCEADNAVGSSMDTVDIRVLGTYFRKLCQNNSERIMLQSRNLLQSEPTIPTKLTLDPAWKFGTLTRKSSQPLPL